MRWVALAPVYSRVPLLASRPGQWGLNGTGSSAFSRLSHEVQRAFLMPFIFLCRAQHVTVSYFHALTNNTTCHTWHYVFVCHCLLHVLFIKPNSEECSCVLTWVFQLSYTWMSEIFWRTMEVCFGDRKVSKQQTKGEVKHTVYGVRVCVCVWAYCLGCRPPRQSHLLKLLVTRVAPSTLA